MPEKVKQKTVETDGASAPQPETSAPAVVGRQYAGQQFYAVTTPEAEAARVELQKEYEHHNAVPLNVYFSHRGITNPVQQASMSAFTTVRRATVEAWDKIFAKH